jgi:hypothetical protein
MKRTSILFEVIVLSLFLFVLSTKAQRSFASPRFGDLFPPHEFPMLSSSEDRRYLGLSEGKTFTIRDIQAELVVFELLSTYCASCQMQAPIYNEVFKWVVKDSTIGSGVRWMGVGIGNNDREVITFRKTEGIPFPIVPDVNFAFYEAIGGPGGVRTPLTLLVRKDERGRGVVVESHIGMRRNKQEIFKEIRAAFQYDLAFLKINEDERAILPKGEILTPPLSDRELIQKIRDAMAISGGVVEEIRRIEPGDGSLFVGRLRTAGGERQLYAMVVSRPPLCDICHDIHFAYIFDETGTIVNFVPIYLTKDANRVWDQSDIDVIKGRVIGRSLLQPFRFNRDVDAVSGATITSVVIYHSLDRGKEIYNQVLGR